MNVVFAGTAPFAVPSLKALLADGHTLAAVYTQPDRPAGRGRKLTASAVKLAALDAGIEVRQPISLRGTEAAVELSALAPELLVVVAYGLILPPGILAVPQHGALNVHGSLLPRWRGAAPVERALLAGDEQTGVSIMRMDAGLDTGPVLLQRALPIRPDDTGGSLREHLARLGAEVLIEALAGLRAGSLLPWPQSEEGACYAAKIGKRDALVEWTLSAAQLERQVRAFSPSPLAHTFWRGDRLRIGAAHIGVGSGLPGQVLAAGPQGIEVACGEASLWLTEVQPQGGRMLTAREFLAGRRLAAGEFLQAPADA